MTGEGVEWADVGGDVEVVDLPPHPRNTRDRLRPLFLKALQHRTMHESLPKHQGWFKVYDRSTEFARSIPERYCVEGAVTMEQIDNDVRERQKELKKKAAQLEHELGRFSIERRGGAIYMKHVGRMPKLDQVNGWFD